MSTGRERPVVIEGVELRAMLRPSDVPAIRTIVEQTGMFHPAEVEIADEVVCDGVDRGEGSGYWFTIAESAGRILGYACFGPIPCTTASFDLYWIAVDPSAQNAGVGRRLLADVEHRIAQAGGRRVYVDTSGRQAYEPARRFYERMGYFRAAVLQDFYAPGDGKVVYLKVL